MNEHEISEAVTRWTYDPVLGPAARTLHNLMLEVNRKSDGWPYWQAPRRASKRLQELLTAADRRRNSSGRPFTREELLVTYRLALTPIRAFRTRHDFDFAIEEAHA